MIAEGSAGAADASAETTSSTTSQGDEGSQRSEDRGQQEQDKQVFGTPVGEILAGMEDLPEEVRASETEAARKEQGAEGGARHGESSGASDGSRSTEEGEEHRTDKTDGTDAGKGAAQPGAAAAAAGAAEDHPVPNEWPQDAKARVKEEADKRRARTAERDTEKAGRLAAEARVAELQKRQPVTVAPTAADPLADVTNEQALVKAHADYEKLLEWATLNADGLEGVQIGLDAQKNPITKDYSKEEMAQIRLTADRILRNAIPQKAAYIQTQKAIEPIARETYPNLFTEGTPEHNELQIILQQLPEITRFPDYQIWIGDAIYRRNQRLAEAEAAEAAKGRGQGSEVRGQKGSPTVQALLTRPAITKTPAPVASAAGSREQGAGSRGGGAGRTNDVVKDAEQKVIESGGDDAAMDGLVESLLDEGAKRRGPQAALV